MIDGRNLFDKPINDLIKQYDEVRKTSIGQDDDYTAGSLFTFQRQLQTNCSWFK